MSYELSLADPKSTEVFYLGSTSDYSDFADWVTTLPDEDYPDIRSLVEDGSFENTTTLKEQIEFALESHPPTVDGVAATAKHVMELIADGAEDETATITDGANDNEPEDAGK